MSCWGENELPVLARFIRIRKGCVFMRERERQTAERFGLLEKIEDLERELLRVDHVVGVEFDLDGFYSDIYQVIVVPEYDIPVSTPDYFEVRKEMLQQVLAVSREHGLLPSGDGIEDYGKHYYIVRNCDASWMELVKLAKDRPLADTLMDAQNRAGSLLHEVPCEKEHNGLY